MSLSSAGVSANSTSDVSGAGLSGRVEAWSAAGELIEIASRRVFVRRSEGPGPLVVFLHGFRSSSYDWRATLERLGKRATLAFDFLGFGLSDKPHDLRYSLFEQADIIEALIGGDERPVVVVAHDMGTSVATELMARGASRSACADPGQRDRAMAGSERRADPRRLDMMLDVTVPATGTQSRTN